MNQRPLFLLLLAVIISFAGGFPLRPILDPASPTIVNDGSSAAVTPPTAPRARQYFAAYLGEARKLMTACREGAARGEECANAH